MRNQIEKKITQHQANPPPNIIRKSILKTLNQNNRNIINTLSINHQTSLGKNNVFKSPFTPDITHDEKKITSPYKINTLAQSKSITSWLEGEIGKARKHIASSAKKRRFHAFSPIQNNRFRLISPKNQKIMSYPPISEKCSKLSNSRVLSWSKCLSSPITRDTLKLNSKYNKIQNKQVNFSINSLNIKKNFMPRKILKHADSNASQLRLNDSEVFKSFD